MGRINQIQCENCGNIVSIPYVKYHKNNTVKSYVCPECTSKVEISEDGRSKSINMNSHELIWILLSIFGPMICVGAFSIGEAFETELLLSTTGFFMGLWGWEKQKQDKARFKLISKMRHEWWTEKNNKG